MKPAAPTLAALFALAAASVAYAAPAATPADLSFVAKVSEGGMFEVMAGKLAAKKGSTQDIRDFGAMEVHDHMLVGKKLKLISNSEHVKLPGKLNAEFQGKYDHLKSLSGSAFDDAYMAEMAPLHDGDGAAFAKESGDGGSASYKGFGAETHLIVERHIGAIHGASPGK